MEPTEQPLSPAPLSAEPLTFDPHEITTQPPSAPKHGFFIGRFGLRAGWGIAVYLIVFVLASVMVTIGSLVVTGKLQSTIDKVMQARSAAKAGHPVAAEPTAATPVELAPRSTAINEGLQFGCLLLAAFAMAKIERRRFGVFGIGRYGLADFLPGAFWGLATLSLLVLVLRSLHLLVFDARALYGSAMVLFGLKWLLVFFFVGCLEEYLFRGYIQYTLMRGLFGLGDLLSTRHARALAFLFASVFTSLLFFMAHTHNAGENGWGLLAVFLAGVVFTYALWRTGSLWWGIGFHMAWDWAQSFLYGVPDSGNVSAGRLFHTHATGSVQLSGGADGPEGSVLVIPTLLIVMVILRFTKAGSQPTLETETTGPHSVERPEALALVA